MTELKTKANDQSVEAFLNGVENKQRREDGLSLLTLMRDVTGMEPRMWGESIIGFGDYKYKYATGREGDWFLVGFSPRKQNITVYGFDHDAALMSKLGKHKTGKGCVYINKLSDIDLDILRELVKWSLEQKSKAD